MKKILLLLAYAALIVGCSKENPLPEPLPPDPPVQPVLPFEYDVTIKVVMPGTLSSQIPNSPFKTIKIDGKLNGSDIKYLRGIIPSLTKIDIGDASIVSGGDAYYGTTHKTADNVIGQYMFSELGGGFEIILPKSVKEIKTEAFAKSNGLLGLELPSIKNLSEKALFECSNLKKITIPESVTSIAAQVFYNCKALEEVELGTNVSTIGTSCFYGCSALTRITLPEKLKVISNNLLDGTSIEQIVIPSATESISSGAFQNCHNLKKITLGKSVKKIHSWSFNLCENIEEVTVNADNPYLTADAGIIYTKDFQEIVLNIACTTTDLDIKDGVQRIRKEAFRQGSPEKLTLPASVTEIEQSAFSYAVKEVHCKGTNPPKISWTVAIGPGHYAGVYAFQQATSTHAILFIPTGTTNKYSAAGYKVCFETITEE